MSRSIRDMRAATDDELIAEHDEIARNTFVGTGYYLEELHRRQELAAMRSSRRLAISSLILAVVSTFAAVAALWVATSR